MQIYPYQQACLDAIESARQAGKKKALVVMATGLGKTVVSALQLKRMLAEKPGRVLYVTHNKEILRQARHTIEGILPVDCTYGYFHGDEKDLHYVDVLFASFQLLRKTREFFARDEFRYVVIDEAHHVQAETFRPTVEYFQPDLMIGLTATPDRGDQKDIRELIGEPVFSLDLFEALAHRHLAQVDYRLMTDELQGLKTLDTSVGRMSIAELNRTVFVPKRDEEIVRIIDEKLRNLSDPRVIIFCSSVAHADAISRLIPHSGVIHYDLKPKEVRRRIAAFRSGRLRVAVTVEMFNEGIDIPEANVIVFLRSTASRTIYLQQLGRGLRLSEGKDQVLVLDFVANCDRVELINSLQASVDNVHGEGSASGGRGLKPSFNLIIDKSEFSEQIINLIGMIARARRGFYTKEILSEELRQFAEELGRTPTIDEVDANANIASVNIYIRAFGKRWNDILKELGLDVAKEYNLDRDTMTRALLDFAKELGRTPTIEEIRLNKALPDASTYRRVFRMKWAEYLISIGLAPNYYRGHTKEHLLARILDLSGSLGGVTPTVTEAINCKYLPGIKTIYDTLGVSSWPEVVKMAGLRPRREPFDKKRMIAQLQDLARELGRSPSARDVNKSKRLPSASSYYSVFGLTWIGILEEAGMKPQKRRYTKDELSRQLYRFVDQNGRLPTRRDVDTPGLGMASATAFRSCFGMSWHEMIVAHKLQEYLESQK